MDAPPFLTQREFDVFLGGGERGQRQRQRLRRYELLPTPAPLGRVQRFNLFIFPRFALAGLVSEFAQLPKADKLMIALTRRAFATREFREISEAVRDAARELDEWRYDLLVAGVMTRAAPAVEAWESVVEAAEAELHSRYDISFTSTLGVVRDIESGICIVSVDDATERFPEARSATPLSEGRAVAVERVKVMGTEQDFLMPAIVDTPDTQERELIEWFNTMANPTGPAPTHVIVEEQDHADRLPYRRATPRRRRRMGTAGTMARTPLVAG